MATVLVVDDEHRLRALLCRLLTSAGHLALSASDAESALSHLRRKPVDLVLLDLMMPRRSGFDVLEVVRHLATAPPVIVLSAVEDVGARVRALDMGAVDFVPKPFHSDELLARVRRHLASPTDQAPGREGLEAGGIVLDLQRRRARQGEREVVLTEREVGLLAHLMRRTGRVCDRDELLREVWGLEFDPGTNVVDACVMRVRRKLPGVAIETVRSVGYCFTED